MDIQIGKIVDFYLEKIKTRMLLPFLEIIQNFFPDIFFLSTGTNNFEIISDPRS